MRTEDAKRVRTIDSLLVELAKERGLDEERTKRAIDLVRFGLLCLLSGDEAHGDMLDRLHAVYRGAARVDLDEDERENVALYDAAAKIEAVARRMATPEQGVEMLFPMLEAFGCETEHLDRKWLVARLAKLRSGLAAKDRGVGSKIGSDRVAAEVAWRCGAFGASGCARNGTTDEPSAEWLGKVRKALTRKRR